MKVIALFIMLASFMIEVGYAGEQVNINITNLTGQTVNLKFGELEPLQSEESVVYKDLGPVKNKTSHMFKAKISKNRKIIFYAELVKGGRTAPCKFDVLSTITAECSLEIDSKEIDNAESLTSFRAKIKEFGPPNSFENLATKNGIQTVLGSLRILNDSGDKIYEIPSNVLGTVMTDFQYASVRRSFNEYFTKNANFSAMSSVPFVLDIAAHFQSSDMVKFEWKIKNAGVVNWKSNDNKSIVTLLFNLGNDDKDYLASMYATNPKAEIYFVNKAYVIENIVIKSYKFKELKKSADVTATIYFGSSANYIESNESGHEEEISNIMTNAWGYQYTGLLKYFAVEWNKQKLAAAQKDDEIKAIYNSFKQSLELPEFTTKESAISALRTLAEKSKVDEKKLQTKEEQILKESDKE